MWRIEGSKVNKSKREKRRATCVLRANALTKLALDPYNFVQSFFFIINVIKNDIRCFNLFFFVRVSLVFCLEANIKSKRTMENLD